MDDLLSEFLTETSESLDVIDAELVRFEADPNDRATLDNIFRLVHTIKGTCGFLGLPRLERVAHAGETLLGRFRDGKLEVSEAAVTLVLESIDCIKSLLVHLESDGVEPEGDDAELIGRLEDAAEGRLAAAPAPKPASQPEPTPAPVAAPAAPAPTVADGETRWDADLGRALRPGEVSLADLEAAFAAADVEDPAELPPLAACSEPRPTAAAALRADEDDEDADDRRQADRRQGDRRTVARADADGERREGASGQATIRVGVDVLENLMTMVSELVLTRNQLLQILRNSDDSEFKAPLQRLSNITAELQDGVMKTRMQPIGTAWKKLPRIVRDCARDVGKKIDFITEGEATELDRQVLELIKDPLTHMVRNSCDHGIERPEDRAMQGKPETGTLRLRAFHEGGHIIIEIADDGAGLNTEKIRRKAVEKGLVDEADAAALTDAQVHRFIFAAGFSTAAQVTNLSGRGVGMDVVRTNIEQIGGAIDLNSVEGRGTTFTIKIPLTLAIVSALIVGAGEQRFAIPQLSVLELVRVGSTSDAQVETINDARVMRLRDRLLPLVDLADILKIQGRARRTGASAFVVVMQVGGQRFGVVVDEVFDTEEIVVKPLASVLRHIPTFSGNTILGDGSVIMIIDPNGVAQTVGSVQDDAERELEAAETVRAEADDKTAMLVFRAGDGEPKAAPLSLVTRLEEIEVERFERANGALVVQYRGALMPLTFAAGYGQLKPAGKQPVLVFTDRDRAAGLIVDEIIDIVEEAVNIEIGSETPGLVGTAVLKGRATDIIDVGHHLVQACPYWFERTPVESEDVAPKRVLLVDDSAFFRNMLSPLLQAAGYEVTAVDSVEAAWSLHDQGREFDAIVTDIEMPGASGLNFAERLKTDDRWGDAPRLALSALDPAEIAAKAPDAFVDFVRKTDRGSIVAALEYALKSAGAAA